MATHDFHKIPAFLFFLLLSFTLSPTHAQAKVIFNGDFETGNTSQFRRSETCCSYSVQAVTSPVRSGKYAARFELRRTDADVANSKRAEILPPSPYDGSNITGGVGDERWFGFSIFIPKDWVDDNTSAEELVWQVHDIPDSCEDFRSPPVSLLVIGGNFVFEKEWDSRACTPGNRMEGVKRFPIGALKKGQWNDFVVHVKWSYGSDGFTQVWRDGTMLVNDKGPNFYNDTSDGYTKIGIYKWTWKSDPSASRVSTRVLDYDDFKIGDASSSYNEVAPPGAVPQPSASPSPTPAATPPSSVPSAGMVSSPTWQNRSFDKQTGSFAAEFDVTPLANQVDAVNGFGLGPMTGFPSAAASLRLNPNGQFDVRKGSGYAADTSLPYVANRTYHVRMEFNVPRHTYSVYVAPLGLTPQPLAKDYPFRTEQSSVPGLDSFGVWAAAAKSHAVTNFILLPPDANVAGLSSQATWQNRAFSKQTGPFFVEYDAIPTNGSVDAVTALSSGSISAFANAAISVRFNPQGQIDVRNGAGYASDVALNYSAGATYRIRVEVDPNKGTYSVYVAPASQAFVRIANGYAFRAEQKGLTSFDNFGLWSETNGALRITGFSLAKPLF